MLKRQSLAGLLLVMLASLTTAMVRAETITVRVLNNFFDPEDITIHVGDTVEWRNVSGVGHNVVSCFPGQFGCDDQTSDTTFSSGAARTFFSYSVTFTEPSYNPYICQPHAPFMIGSVTVIEPTPPAVPMSARPVGFEGSWLEISWNEGACPGAESYHLVYGGGADLPAAPGGAFTIKGAKCAVAQSPYIWTNPPDPAGDPRGLIWWILLANDGSSMEGSWGLDGDAQERVGPAPDGASGECGMVNKDVGNTCGQ